ncbi:hypothetical protein ACFL1B_01530 [Nanoarchaeota archaeon]
MDVPNAIRAGIFLVGGLVSIIFREKLNNVKNRMLEKLHFEKKVKDERKAYVYIGIIFIVISVILFVYSITH